MMQRQDLLECTQCGGLHSVHAMLPSTPDPESAPICHPCATIELARRRLEAAALSTMMTLESWREAAMDAHSTLSKGV